MNNVSWIPPLVGAVVVWIVSVAQYMLGSRPRPTSHGVAAAGWSQVAKVFRCRLRFEVFDTLVGDWNGNQIESGRLKGGALSVYHNGELVVELCGGQAEPNNNLSWENHTLTQAYSTTKGVVAVVVAMLVDRGLIHYFDPVSKYWPEFAAEGKEDVTVEQLLSHRSGLPVTDAEYSMYDILTDEKKVGEILAAQKPVWTPGTQHGYHGITLGLYVDQLVRRVDPNKRDLRTFFDEEIAVPFGIDFHIGLPKEENYRCARAYQFSFLSTDIFFASRYYSMIYAYMTDKHALISKQLKNPPELVMDLGNDPAFREIPCGSSHGFGTATSIAKLFGILSNGGIHEGKRLLSTTAIARLNEPLSIGWDNVLRMQITYGRGVTLREVYPCGYMFGAPGAGGQMGYADPQHKLGIAFLTNYMSIFAIGDDPRYLELEQAIYTCVRELSGDELSADGCSSEKCE